MDGCNFQQTLIPTSVPCSEEDLSMESSPFENKNQQCDAAYQTFRKIAGREKCRLGKVSR